MRDFIETTFACRVLQWDEPSDFGPVFSALKDGRLIVADSLMLLLAALSESQRRLQPHLRLAA